LGLLPHLWVNPDFLIRPQGVEPGRIATSASLGDGGLE
jgi:hypothetical protein